MLLSATSLAIFNVYKWRHDDVIVIKLTASTQYSIPSKTCISDFSCFDNFKMTPFCNLFMERLSYISAFQIIWMNSLYIYRINKNFNAWNNLNKFTLGIFFNIILLDMSLEVVMLLSIKKCPEGKNAPDFHHFSCPTAFVICAVVS